MYISVFINRWRSLKVLWTTSKTETVAEFLTPTITLSAVNETFRHWEVLDSKYTNLPDQHTVGVVRLNVSPLKQAVHEHNLEWRQTLGEALLKRTQHDLYVCRDRVEHLRMQINAKARNIDIFKSVMAAVLCVGVEKLTMATQIRHFGEVFNVLTDHNIEVSFSDSLHKIQDILKNYL